MRRHLSLLIGSLVLGLALLIAPAASWAYPFWAQQNYDSPREATGKIVCANCHLAQKLTQAEVPQSVLPDSVFKASVKIPYESGIQEIGADGSQVPLQVGAVVMLPDGFTLAPQDRWTDEILEETEGVYFSQYSDDQPNILLVGPIPGDQHQEIVFPVLSPNPATDSSIHFGKYQIHVGGNRGRGQVYPTGEKSNNAVYTAPATGTIAGIEPGSNMSKDQQYQAINGVLRRAEVVCATCAGAGSDILERFSFQACLIDEATRIKSAAYCAVRGSADHHEAAEHRNRQHEHDDACKTPLGRRQSVGLL